MKPLCRTVSSVCCKGEEKIVGGETQLYCTSCNCKETVFKHPALQHLRKGELTTAESNKPRAYYLNDVPYYMKFSRHVKFTNFEWPYFATH